MSDGYSLSGDNHSANQASNQVYGPSINFGTDAIVAANQAANPSMSWGVKKIWPWALGVVGLLVAAYLFMRGRK